MVNLVMRQHTVIRFACCIVWRGMSTRRRASPHNTTRKTNVCNCTNVKCCLVLCLGVLELKIICGGGVTELEFAKGP
jgi:hypothetical protein